MFALLESATPFEPHTAGAPNNAAAKDDARFLRACAGVPGAPIFSCGTETTACCGPQDSLTDCAVPLPCHARWPDATQARSLSSLHECAALPRPERHTVRLCLSVQAVIDLFDPLCYSMPATAAAGSLWTTATAHADGTAVHRTALRHCVQRRLSQLVVAATGVTDVPFGALSASAFIELDGRLGEHIRSAPFQEKVRGRGSFHCWSPDGSLASPLPQWQARRQADRLAYYWHRCSSEHYRRSARCLARWSAPVRTASAQ